MDLFIETLTGTAFELKVSPNDTVMSIKSKIQRVEGIPIGQQHLIWQNGELSDHQSLRDCSIPGGATLRLVLGLRGGPVNAYRTPAALRLTPLHFAPPSFERITPPPRSSSNSTTTGPNKHSVTMSSQQTYVSSSPVITQPSTAADEIPDQNNAAAFESNTTSAASPALGRTNVSKESSRPTATSRDVLTQPDTSSANRKHITFVIFDSGDNLNLVHVIDRNPSVDRSSDSANQLKPTSVEDRAAKAKSVERHPCDSGSFVGAHSLARLQAEPAVNRDSEDDNQHLKAPAVLLGTPSGSSSQSKTLTNRKPPASKMPASVPSAPSSPPSPSTPSSAAAALLAGLLYAAGSRSRDPVSAAEDDVLSASDGERSTFPCSYWLRPSSPEWDYEDIKSLYRSAEDEEIGSGGCGAGGLTTDEFPFYDDVDDEEENGADEGGLQGDDDSLADLEDYFLYYHTGDILFGPSPRNSLLRDSLLTGVESVVSGCRSGTRTGERISTAKREECSHLAEKVKKLKAQLMQARENRLKRRNKATGDTVSSAVETSAGAKDQDTNATLNVHEKLTPDLADSTTTLPIKAASPTRPKLSAPPATPRLRSRHSLQRPYTSSIEMSPRLTTVGAGDRGADNAGIRTPPVRHSFDLLRPRGTAPPSVTKVSNNLSVAPAPTTSLLLPPSTTLSVSRKPSGISCFTRALTDSSIATTRQRRFGTVQPPDISRISNSIFPPLFPTKQTPPGIESGGGRLSRPLSIPKVTSRETTESSRKNPPPDASQKELRLPLLSPGHVSLQSQGLAKGSQWQSTSRASEEPVAPKSRHDMSEPPTNRKPTQAKANRCASCNRKTGLSNSYTCRCGNNFCSRHRYAELHSCPYDYKAEARRCLQLKELVPPPPSRFASFVMLPAEESFVWLAPFAVRWSCLALALKKKLEKNRTG
ncbi:AN1-type zinc finger protein 4 [Sparganum proliferum]